MKIDTNFNIQEYMSIVSEIVDGFFDEDDNYIPHIGRLASMEAFFNHCVKEHNYVLPEQSDGTPYPIDVVFMDEDFLKEYNRALNDDKDNRLNFRNAVLDAMAIVCDKKADNMRTVKIISAFAERFFDPDNLAKLFGESKRVQDIADNENIVSFVGQVLNKQ